MFCTVVTAMSWTAILALVRSVDRIANLYLIYDDWVKSLLKLVAATPYDGSTKFFDLEATLETLFYCMKFSTCCFNVESDGAEFMRAFAAVLNETFKVSNSFLLELT